MLKAYEVGDTAKALEIIMEVVSQPVMSIEQDFEIFISKRTTETLLTVTNKDKRIKDIVLFWMRNHYYLRSTNDWYLFLTHIADLYSKAGGANTPLAGRPEKQRSIIPGKT